MGVDLPQKSERYRQMMQAAETYFRFLRVSGEDTDELSADEQRLRILSAAEQRLNELSAPFSDDPAFQALLKLERETQRGGGGDATR